MRLSCIHELDSRDGASNRDARLTNVLSETDEGTTLAVLRPAISTIATASGNGSGVTAFNGVLISVFGTTLGHGEAPSTIGPVVAGRYDFVASPL
jgi:hypothetical protein